MANNDYQDYNYNAAANHGIKAYNQSGIPLPPCSNPVGDDGQYADYRYYCWCKKRGCPHHQKNERCPYDHCQESGKEISVDRAKENDVRSCCADIIASIALTETSIAYILNAEGEKIQKILEISCCPNKILEVNCNVKETLCTATRLEELLCKKLEIVAELLKYVRC
ncbi:MAG: hypothetical protein LBK41_07335 [Clostridiales bacterium]|jgi:hypothetical protein|nr:hypothetical protein [Clostridiales bacterium]